jgi:hypothetical protein
MDETFDDQWICSKASSFIYMSDISIKSLLDS